MSRQAWLSFLGLYNWDNTIFDNMVLPDGFDGDDKMIIINNLLMESAELEVLYPDPDFMKLAIEAWSNKEVINWDRLYKAMLAEYNPIENYNRTEKTNIQNRGSIEHSGRDIFEDSNSDMYKDERTSYDSNVYQPTGRTTRTGGVTDTTIHGHKVTDQTGSLTQSTISGNIGVTTSQQMLEQEIEITPKLNIYDIIIDSFKKRFCLLIY